MIINVNGKSKKLLQLGTFLIITMVNIKFGAGAAAESRFGYGSGSTRIMRHLPAPAPQNFCSLVDYYFSDVTKNSVSVDRFDMYFLSPVSSVDRFDMYFLSPVSSFFFLLG
jgi:hypothetical protein